MGKMKQMTLAAGSGFEKHARPLRVVPRPLAVVEH